MVTGRAPVQVDPKTASPDFWKRYHAYRRMRQMETRPDDPLRPDGLEEMRMKRDDPFSILYRYEVSDGGEMLSWLGAEIQKPGTPGYEGSKHLFWVDWSVHPAHRRHGIGRSWVPLVIELMDRHGCTVFSTGTEEESGHAFLKWLGASAKFTGAENRLKLADVDWEMLRRWVAEGSKRNPDSRLELYDGRIPEELWDDYAPQFTRILNTAPFEDMDHGDIVITPDHMREWFERMSLSGEVQHSMWIREPDAVISAMTDIAWAPHRSTILNQQFTGVHPDARGRGLGKWIKAAMLLHVRDLYPDAHWVSTDNAGSNAPMLAINKRIGFKQFRAATVYQMSRDALASRFHNRASRS